MHRRLILIALFGLMIHSLPAQQQPRVVGYLPYYRFGLVDQIALDKLTHLCLAFANPDANGNLSVGGADIAPVVTAAQNQQVKVLLSLAGGALTTNWAAYWALHTQPQNRAAFIHKIITYMQAYNMDGLDVDLEWSHVDQNYSGFVLQLRDSLDAYGKLMTAALPGTHRYSNMSDEAMHAYDFINMMAYDLTGPWAPNNPGPHSPYTFALSAINYWKAQGVSGEKLTLGVPFYGWDFTDPNDVHSVTFGGMVAQNTAYADLDQVGDIYYNGISTIMAKTELALEEVSGVMIWELGQDAFNEYSLLTTIHETVSNFVSTEETGTPDKRTLSILAFPNPFDAVLNLRSQESSRVQLSLFSLQGQLLLEKELEAYTTDTWDAAGLPSGSYVIRAVSGDAVKAWMVHKR
ncbi:MAG TPA: glycosyl hydrolase family 18 protein [Saprospiraceae bacterium]|nr:glycosyl hydrolase family 18 protein [Saprospiraceae bacterium]HMQ82270.1 glycosyl hydrolase family 18 protein [Saprospiraceae bacterium]